MDIIDLFQRGGMAMYPILLCSVLAVMVFFERLWSLRRSRLIPKGFVENFRERLANGRSEEAHQLCETYSRAPIARIAAAGLARKGQGLDMIRFAVSEADRLEAEELEGYQVILGTVAYLSPLLGLFGTVSGMIKAFEVISHHTVVDPPLLASGISEALITTYAGLLVAIPAVVMDRFVQKRCDGISLELDKKSVVITDALVVATEETNDPSLLSCAG